MISLKKIALLYINAIAQGARKVLQQILYKRNKANPFYIFLQNIDLDSREYSR